VAPRATEHSNISTDYHSFLLSCICQTFWNRSDSVRSKFVWQIVVSSTVNSGVGLQQTRPGRAFPFLEFWNGCPFFEIRTRMAGEIGPRNLHSANWTTILFFHWKTCLSVAPDNFWTWQTASDWEPRQQLLLLQSTWWDEVEAEGYPHSLGSFFISLRYFLGLRKLVSRSFHRNRRVPSVWQSLSFQRYILPCRRPAAPREHSDLFLCSFPIREQATSDKRGPRIGCESCKNSSLCFPSGIVFSLFLNGNWRSWIDGMQSVCSF
jgi:hypothetical protein